MSITTEIRLRPEIILQIRDNQNLKNRMQLELKISHTTLYRHLDMNSDKFTTATALKIISEELGIPKDNLLTE